MNSKSIDNILQQYDDLFVKLLHLSSAPSAFINLEDKSFVFLNVGFSEITGYSREELFGKNWNSVTFWVHTYDEEKIVQLIESEKSIKGYEFPFLTKSGEIKYAIGYFETIEYFDGNYLFMQILDITNRKLFEEQLKNAKEKAEELNRIKTSFFATMSHELRSPLMGILGCADILKSEMQSARSQHLIELIQSNGKKLLETIELILDIAKYDTERTKPVISSVDIIPLINAALQAITISARKKGLGIQTSFRNQVQYLDINEQMFNSILQHLLRNAVKYTEKGYVKVSVDNDQHLCEISVEDTGIGIRESDIDTLFSEFRNVKGESYLGFDGSGLGLSLIKKYVELLNGTISVKSKVNSGTIFTLTFPVNTQT